MKANRCQQTEGSAIFGRLYDFKIPFSHLCLFLIKLPLPHRHQCGLFVPDIS